MSNTWIITSCVDEISFLCLELNQKLQMFKITLQPDRTASSSLWSFLPCVFIPFKNLRVTNITEIKRSRDQGQEGALVLLVIKLGPRQFEYSTVQLWPIFYI